MATRRTYSMEERQNNFNAQTWVDVRMFADVCLFYQKEGLEIKTATILRDCLERVHSAIVEKLPVGELFTTTNAAIDFLRSIGISTAQLETDKRARKKIGDSLALEERFIDQGGSLEKLKAGVDAKHLLHRMGYSREQLDAAVKTLSETLDRSTEEDRITVADASKESLAQRALDAAERDRRMKEADEDFIRQMTPKKD